MTVAALVIEDVPLSRPGRAHPTNSLPIRASSDILRPQRFQSQQAPRRQHPLRTDPRRPRGTFPFRTYIFPTPTNPHTQGLFSRIGPLISLEIKYDRAGRSEGTAFVTYEHSRDATQAIREFDGANAAGQPIRLTLLPSGPSRRGGDGRSNPFESGSTGGAASAGAGRPLAERITVPGQGRSRSLSPRRGDRESDEEAARRGVDRYRPRGGGGGGGDRGSGRLSRSRSPYAGGGGRRRDNGGRRQGGGRRDGGGGGRGRGERGGGGGGGERGERGGGARPKKTQEELDAEMEDYFAGGSKQAGAAEGEAAVTQAPQQDLGEDIDMIQ